MRDYRLLTLSGALLFGAMGTSSPLMTLYLADLGASFAQISLVLTTFMATALASNYASGYLSDRLQRRKPLLVGGLWLMALAYLALANVPAAGMAWGIRVVEGAGLGAFSTLSLAMMGDLLEDSAQRGRRMGLYRGIGSVAFGVGAVAGGWLVSRSSIPIVFTATAGAHFLAGAIALLLQDNPGRDRVDPAPGAPAAPVRLPPPYLAGVFLWTMAVAGAASMWPNAMAALGYSRQTISNLWGLAALIELPGMQGAGMLSDVAGRAPLLAVGGFGMALVFTGYVLVARWLPALLAVQVVRGLAYGSYTTSAMTFAAEHASRRTRGSVSGIFAAATSAGQLTGTLAAGFVVQAAGFDILFWLCVLAATASGLSFVTLHRTHGPAIRPTAGRAA